MSARVVKMNNDLVKVNIFQLEVGVLLKEDNKDYNSYNEVFGGLHSYFNENNIYFLNETKAKEYGENYVKNGVDRTYYILSKLEQKELPTSELEGIEEYGDSNYLNSYYKEDCIINSEVKIVDKHIFDFTKKTKLM